MPEHPIEIDPNSLIRELPAWNNGAGIDAESWIGCVGNFELAVGYSLLFWPRFVVVRDHVLLVEPTGKHARYREQLVQDWERTFKHDAQSVEAMMNHLHIADMHMGGPEPTEDQVRYLGRVLREIYASKLKLDFPERAFVVSFTDEPGLPLEDYQLTFWQVRGPPEPDTPPDRSPT